MTYHGLELPQDKIAEFCRRHHIRRLSLFGSILRQDFRPDSDIDILVEFEPGLAPGFLRLAEMEEELTALLDHRVDLRTPGDLSRYFRDEVLASAVTQYAALPGHGPAAAHAGRGPRGAGRPLDAGRGRPDRR